MRKLDHVNLAKWLLFTVLILGSLSSAYAQSKKPLAGKVDPRLLNLEKQEKFATLPPPKDSQNTQHIRKGSQAKQTLKPSSPPRDVLIIDGYVAIEAIAVDDVKALLSQLIELGLKEGASFGGMVSGLLPIDSVEKLRDVSVLRFARPAYLKTNIGATTTQGDQVLFSDTARSQFKVTGQGNKIGVISDSYNALGGADEGIASGDLPGDNNPNGYLHPVEVLDDLPEEQGFDEGRAMIEIIHDVAPGAEIAFHTAFKGQANFAQGILDLADTGANIIVDDVLYLAEPFFQDGIITQAVDMASQQGVSYFSAAGNSDRNSYESEFRPTADTVVLPVEFPVEEDSILVYPSPYVFHDFDPGPGVDMFQEITFEEGFNIFTASLQWDEPFASVCEGCPGSRSDLDFFIAFEEDTGAILYEISSFFNNIDSDPVEIPAFAFEVDAPTSLYLLIGKYVEDPDTPDPNIIKYISFDDGTINEYPTYSPTVVGHANGANTISTGASFFFRNPLYFPELYNTPAINSYSSAGGVPILFNTKGERIEPEIRENPDVTGPDAGNTTFFIPGLLIQFEIPGTTEPDSFPQFTGTSAAAPHVAAVAALMNEAAGETLDHERISEVLQATATDMDDPATQGFDEGYDFKTGAGFVNARKAVATVYPLPSVVSFTLINATTNEEMGELGDRIELSQIEGEQFSIRADVISGTSQVSSVMFTLNGTEDRAHTENYAPYALFGDNSGEYNGETLPLGEYTLTAIPFTRSNGKGEEGVKLTVSFEVTRTPIASFSLVNAATDEIIDQLMDGDTVNVTTYPEISVVANPEFDNFTGSIAFVLDGEQVQIENNSPYTIAGDHRGDIAPLSIEPGYHTLTATPFSEERAEGDTGTALTVNFQVIERQEVTALILVDRSTNQDIDSLRDSTVIQMEDLSHFYIRAEVNSSKVGSVEFSINGQIISRDSSSPFTLQNDESLNLPPGEYVITATPYSKQNGLGTAGLPLSVTVILQLDLEVTEFVLVDAESDTPIQTLRPGDTLDVSVLPPVSIEAKVNADNVESVVFILNDERVAIENDAPYTIGGNQGSNYYPFDLDTGAYILTAIPYSANDLRGVKGTSLTVGFVVVDVDDRPITESMRLVAYPNPVKDKLAISADHAETKIVDYAILNDRGQTIGTKKVVASPAIEIDLTPYGATLGAAGFFYIKVASNTGKTRTFRIMRE